MTVRARIFLYMIVIFGGAQWAQAQTCSASSSPRTVRVEGSAELTADFVVTCTGGSPAAAGQPLATVDFTLSVVSGSITSRRIVGDLGGTWSEALLLVDEPAPSSLRMCDAPDGLCTMTGVGTGAGTYNGTAGRFNVFQGERPNPDALIWAGIPFDSPGAGTRTFRFTNIRIDAAELENPSSLALTISTQGYPLTIANATQTVAISQPSFAATDQGAILGPNGISSFQVVMSETQSNTWRPRTIAMPGGSDSAPGPIDQNLVGVAYPSESGFRDGTRFVDIARSPVTQAGLSDSGTRLMMRLEGIPGDVTVTVPIGVSLMEGSVESGYARLLTDVGLNGYGPFVPASSGVLANNFGVVIAVYEILNSNPSVPETVRVPVSLTYDIMAGPLPVIEGSASLGPIGAEVEGGTSPVFGGFQPFTVSILAPNILPPSLPPGIVDRSYSFQLTASGGTQPYTWSATGLPAGFTISSTGRIDGTPTEKGTYSVTVTVLDALSESDIRTFTLQIDQPLTLHTLSPLPSGLVLEPYRTSFFASGGVPPYLFSLSGAAVPGLTLSAGGVLSGTPAAQGSYTFQVTVTDQSFRSASKSYQLDIAGLAPVLQPTTLKMEFTSSIGGDHPPAQSLALISRSQQPAPFAITLSDGPRAAAPGWLVVSLDNGVVPARLTVSINQTGLTPGNYSARITVTQPGDPTQAPIVIEVSLSVKATAPNLEVTPDGIEFSATRRAPGKQQRTLAIRNSGGGGPIGFTASTVQQSRWITQVTPSNGTTLQDGTRELTLEIDSTGLAVGQYRDVLRVASSTQTIEVPITLFVAEGGALLDLSLSGVQFRTRVGNNLPVTREVKVINRGDPGTTVRWTAQKITGGDWLTLVNTSGATAPGTPDTLTLQLAPSAAGKPEGSEYALIKVTDEQAAGSPQYLLAVLQIAPVQAPALPELQTSGVVFFAPPFSSAPQSKTVGFGVSNAVPLAFQTSALPEGGGTWLSVTPTSGAVSSAQPAALMITASSAGLPAGIYRGEVVIGRGDTVRSINVTFIVSEAAGAGLAEAAPRARAADCTPNRLALTSTGMPNHFQVPAGWPATLTVELYDNCARPVSNASVVASFSNSDPPLTLLPDGVNGVYSATWEPGTPLTNVNVTIRATAGGLEPSAPLLIGDVLPNRVPKLAHNGIVHNLNPQLLGALSPGVVAQIYGTDLASVTESTGAVPLATSYKGTHVLVGNYDAPLYYVSPTQLVVQFPVELPPNVPASIVVQAPGGITVPEQVIVVPAKPGVAAFNDNRLIVQHANFTLVDAANPARPGEVLTMYLVGLGTTNPPVATGRPSPGAEPLARPLVTPTVTVGGQNATVAFAGLTPFGVGLYQINFVVPANAPTGVPLDVIVKQGDEQGNTTTLTLAP